MKFELKNNKKIKIEQVDDFYQIQYHNKNVEKIKDCSLYEGIFIEPSKDKKFLNYHIEIDRPTYGTIKVVSLTDYKNITYKKENFEKVIQVYVPNNISKDFGLIIMFDSDNLYSIEDLTKYTDSPDDYGSWEVNRTLELVKRKYNKDFIVVGISSKDGYRDQELTFNLPYQEIRKEAKNEISDSFYNGRLDNIGRFITESVIPILIEKFSIDLNYIGIAGASSGGLASFYLSLVYPNIFKFSFVFSPANGVFSDETFIKLYKMMEFKNKNVPYIYYYQGGTGSVESLLYKGNLNFVNNLIQAGYPQEKIESYINESFRHNEIAWRLAFVNAMDWIMNVNEKE